MDVNGLRTPTSGGLRPGRLRPARRRSSRSPPGLPSGDDSACRRAMPTCRQAEGEKAPRLGCQQRAAQGAAAGEPLEQRRRPRAAARCDAEFVHLLAPRRRLQRLRPDADEAAATASNLVALTRPSSSRSSQLASPRTVTGPGASTVSVTPFACATGLDLIHQRRGELRRIHGRAFKRDLARLGPCQGQELTDETRRACPAPPIGRSAPGDTAQTDMCLLHQGELGAAPEGGERRAKLMRGVRALNSSHLRNLWPPPVPDSASSVRSRHGSRHIVELVLEPQRSGGRRNSRGSSGTFDARARLLTSPSARTADTHAPQSAPFPDANSRTRPHAPGQQARRTRPSTRSLRRRRRRGAGPAAVTTAYAATATACSTTGDARPDECGRRLPRIPEESRKARPLAPACRGEPPTGLTPTTCTTACASQERVNSIW